MKSTNIEMGVSNDPCTEKLIFAYEIHKTVTYNFVHVTLKTQVWAAIYAPSLSLHSQVWDIFLFYALYVFDMLYGIANDSMLWGKEFLVEPECGHLKDSNSGAHAS